MTLTATLKSSVQVTQTAASDLESAESRINSVHTLTYSDGAGAGQANVQFSDRRTLAASTDEDLDLAGSLSNLLGTTIFARVKYIRITASDNNTNDVVVTRTSVNGLPGIFLNAGDGVSIPPGGRFEWGDPGADGVAITPSTGDLLNIANGGSGTSVTYDIVIIGSAT